MRRASLLGLIIVLTGACVGSTGRRDEVHDLLADRSAFDRRDIELTGILRMDHGVANLYSRDGRECIGLVSSAADQPHYRALDGRRVHVRGKLDAEGCGLRGMCTHQMCGPAIMRDVTVRGGLSASPPPP